MSAQSQFVHVLFIAFLVSGAPEILRAGGNPRSNEEIMVGLSREAADIFCADVKISDTTSIALNTGNGEINRFFSQPLLESFSQHFVSLYARSGAPSVDILVSVAEVGVTYGEPFSDGFFSGRKSQRTVGIALRFAATRSADGKVLWAGTEKRSFSDTVYVDEISKLQESSKHIASGPLPDRSALERFIGPLIIAGAAGIAIYLFFTIRS